MCGILGYCLKEGLNAVGLDDALERLYHRGPDSYGKWFSSDRRLGLLHRRLSILDLSSAGHQPMITSDKQHTIIFNGEIYNQRELRTELEIQSQNGAGKSSQPEGIKWRGHSDTEIVLAAYANWGIDCLKHLNGMFAFVIYDDRNKKLFLARDRAGEKPLFFRLENENLWFASELKALMAVPGLPRKINSAALDCFLAFGYVPGPMCILEGYQKLPPAHAMIFDLKQNCHRIWQWWRLPAQEAVSLKRDFDEPSLLTELEKTLEDAVAKQLYADVPVGVLLSGGVDSSLVTAMAARASAKIKTFTVGFPGHKKFDETSHARLVAGYFNTMHTELMASSPSAELIPLMARQFDEPLADSSMIPTYLVSRLISQHCKVALGGDGGDELFGGYEHYRRLNWMQKRLVLVPRCLLKGLGKGCEFLLPVGLKGRNYMQSFGMNLKSELPFLNRLFDQPTRNRLLLGRGDHRLVAEKIWQSRVPESTDILQKATRMDFSNYLPEDILVKTDRSTMLTSLELRSPFLDHRLIEFAFAKVPSHLKATDSDKKILLKKLASKILPKNLDIKRKQGFSIPLGQWIKEGPFREIFWDTLTRQSCLFNKNIVQNLFKQQKMGLHNEERLFALLTFELWRDFYSVKV